MASAAARVGGSTSNIGLLVPVVGVVGLASAVLAGRRAMHVDWKDFVVRFLTGPGRTSRILLLIYVLLNTKSLPGAWTIRVFGSMIRHAVQLRKPLPPKALFHYSVTRSYTSPGETDYNLHKSNSTYFSDLDVARSQCVMHLMATGFDKIRHNKKLQIVRDPAGDVVDGSLGVALGAVACSFKKELPPLAGFEMWTRVLAWDRKWLYTMTHFVAPAGKVKPTSWDGGSFWASRGEVRRAADGAAVSEAELQKHVVASAVGKYVFKLGRFTVHPSYVLEQSGLLPERPVTGWRGGEGDVHAEVELPAGSADLAEWDWRRVEAERRKGMELARHFAAIDDAHVLFDGGKDGALGQFFPG